MAYSGFSCSGYRLKSNGSIVQSEVVINYPLTISPDAGHHLVFETSMLGDISRKQALVQPFNHCLSTMELWKKYFPRVNTCSDPWFTYCTHNASSTKKRWGFSEGILHFERQDLVSVWNPRTGAKVALYSATRWFLLWMQGCFCCNLTYKANNLTKYCKSFDITQ